MKLELKKFGTILISRQAGKEAFAAFQSTLKEIGTGDTLEIDFDGVVTFSPSWGDEFLVPILDQLGDRLSLLSTNNPSVKATIALLEKITGKKFKFVV